MRARHWIPLPALAMVLGACENYTSPVPLAWSGVAPFDERLLGHWIERGDSLILEVLEDEPTGYVVLTHWMKPPPPDSPVAIRALAGTRMEPYRAFLTDVAGTRFANARELRTSPASYMFFRLELTPADSLVLRPVRNCGQCRALPHFRSSRELRDFLLSNLANDSIFGPAMVYGRLELPDPDSGSVGRS